ncbi:acyl-CoA N-acyltransferase [Ilyonectria robusta]|uniref:acyl-CoA N-acyltransferase n=1 Tax=Ilyonectria robusta TaxID=1079257 RepID=UPI001E8CCAAE|nr:acyl-CoA N-acyltransferase [Ilyonectria robusta]KAH8680336.1 acyl-CoA N-acyltransferase [Ilyonectria robusta]
MAPIPDPFAQEAPIKTRLPHPYKTTYTLERTAAADGIQSYALRKAAAQEPGTPFPHTLHNDQLVLSRLPAEEADTTIDENDNTPWANARRSPVWTASWASQEAPTTAQVWLFLYTFFSVDSTTESIRFRVEGAGAAELAAALLNSMVAIEHPKPSYGSTQTFQPRDGEVLVLRSAFWQGCASPLGTQPIWLPAWNPNVVPHVEYTLTPTDSTLLRHPRRAPKPAPSSVIYSRYIPSLDQHFSLQAIDYRDPVQLELFHNWQNDPRVAKGWMESGSLEHHRTYLNTLHDDPHTIPVFGCLDDKRFAYFEIYWAKEDKMGAHYPSLDFDRGRHALVGDASYRGQHIVMSWWPSIMHYTFLDDCRTEQVVGEPRLTNEKILMYEMIFGLHQNKYLDLPHKRANLVVCSRERFFQLCPFQQMLPRVAGTNFGFEPKL